MSAVNERNRVIQSIKAILEELASNPDDYDTLKLACEIHQMCWQPVIDSQINMADPGALDSLADMREE